MSLSGKLLFVLVIAFFAALSIVVVVSPVSSQIVPAQQVSLYWNEGEKVNVKITCQRLVNVEQLVRTYVQDLSLGNALYMSLEAVGLCARVPDGTTGVLAERFGQYMVDIPEPKAVEVWSLRVGDDPTIRYALFSLPSGYPIEHGQRAPAYLGVEA